MRAGSSRSQSPDSGFYLRPRVRVQTVYTGEIASQSAQDLAPPDVSSFAVAHAEVIFDAGPGELFVVRNVANIIPPYAPDGQAHGVSAALEFGVGALRVKHIVVLGHAHCGGIKAFAEDAEPLSPGDFIGKWMRLMAPAADKVGPRGDKTAGEYLRELEWANVRNSLDNLMTFPRLAQLIDKGKVVTHGAYFGVATGDLSVLDKASGNFMPVERATPSIAPRL